MVTLGTLVALWLTLHLPPHTHGCHLYASDWWSEALTVEYALTHQDGASLVARTSNGCWCLIFVPRVLIQEFDIILAGRTFIGAGWIEEGELILQKVCESFEGCVASRTE